MDINNALQRAQFLMNSEEFNNRVDAYSRTAKRSGRGGMASAALPNEALLEQQLFGVPAASSPTPQVNPASYMPTQPTEADFDRHPGLPREIIESYKKNPSPLTDLSPAVYEQMRGMLNEAPSASSPASAPSAHAGGEGVNYELIKYIVKECLKEQNTINEGAGIVKGMRVANGGVIQFIDTKGNLYEGKLVLKKKKA